MLWGMVLVLLVAAGLRLVVFGQVPPGLYHDEAYHGLDASRILEGNFSLYFAENNGREPLFVYLTAVTLGLLGKSPFALRLAAFPVGLLAVAATATLGRALFSRRVGLLAGAVLAVTVWHVHLSRVGFRAVLMPLFTALTVWQVVEGIKSGARRRWLAAGVLYGLCAYTYTAVRFTPFALAAFGLYALAVRFLTRDLRPLLVNRQLWRGVGLAALVMLVVAAPLAVHAVRYPEIVLGRPGQVSISNPLIHKGDFWGTVWSHTLRTLGMFFVRGDRIWRHNVPWRPVFDPVLGATFVVGLLVAVRRLRRDLAVGFVVIWTAVMSLPTLLAEDAPHFLRAVGVLPVVVFFPALGLDWLLDRVRGPRLRLALATLPLLFGLGSTIWDYFGDYGRDPVLGYWFQQGAAALAGRVNQFLGVGWDGQRMVRGGPGDRWAYVDPRLWEYWPTIQFLIAAPEAMTLGLEGEPPSNSVAIFTWPFGNWRQVWDLLPRPTEFVFEEGPPSRGDNAPDPYATYLAFFATPPDPAEPVLARFSGGVELLGVELAPAGADRLRVRLRWRATAPLEKDYTVFLHYLRDGERIVQADNQPAGGRYPTTLWSRGDVVNDDHIVTGVGSPLQGRDVLLFGFWEPESQTVLYWLDEAGNPAGDWIEMPVESLPGRQ
jgi:4-amino-4-deoxy-L-arabinose transferase-like glycosyltransferase